MKRLAYTFLASLCLLTTMALTVSAQNYSAPEVTVSKEKVKAPDGNVYYTHIVQERQTLFSICKAYGVTLKEVYAANRYLNLETEGLKKEQILLIPAKDVTSEQKTKEEPVTDEKKAPAANTEKTKENVVSKVKSDDDGYIVYKVKWYDDLDGIAAKYNVSKSAIMNFNGMTSEELERKQDLKIPKNPSKWEKETAAKPSVSTTSQQTTVKETVAKNQEKTIIDSDDKTEHPIVQTVEPQPQNDQPKPEEKKDESILDDLFVKEGNHDVSITMALPFNVQKGRNEQMFDFYSGALLAAEQLGKAGINVNLNVYDVAGGTMPITHERFEESNFVIGPVSPSDIKNAVRASEGESWIVSPLDPKVEAIADTTSNVIQAPAAATKQIADMIEWIKSDMDRSDKVVVITEKNAKTSSYNSSVLSAVRNSGLNFTQSTFGVMEVKTIMTTLEKALISTGCNRVIIASDNKTFVTEAVKNLYLVANSKKIDIQLYATAKLKSFEGEGGINVEQLHALNMHLSAAYLIDYEANDVKKFLKTYRALFNAEPGPSAFQGYDLMMAFSTLANKYGNKWEKRLDRVNLTGLQSDIRLIKTENGGYINSAVRRMVYEPDYTMRFER